MDLSSQNSTNNSPLNNASNSQMNMGTDSVQNSQLVPTPEKHPRLHKFISVTENIFKIILPMGVSVGLVLWLFHKVNIEQIKQVLTTGVRFEFIACMMFLTMLSYIIRGIRWGIQLRGVGVPRMSPVAESVSIFGLYALNLIVQYLGETWRCVYVAKKEKVKLATVFGTDIGDRISDLVMILIIIGITMCFASHEIQEFFHHYSLGRVIERIADQWWIYAIILAVLILFFLADWEWRHTKFFSGVNLSFSRIWDGFRVLFYMKGKWEYFWLTLGIWTCYFLETYLCFYAFPFTRELINLPGSGYGLVPGLVVFVFGGISMAVPSNGGLGPWNVAVMYALMLYGISQTDATAYSLVVWAFQAMMIIACGIFAAIYVIMTRNSSWDLHKKSTPVTISKKA